MSHDALKRLGVFSVGDQVVFQPWTRLESETRADVISLANDEGPRQRNGHVRVRLSTGIVRWVLPSQLRHRTDLMREEALRRLQTGVHLQTVVQAWAHNVGLVERDGDPLCGATGGEMCRAEARVTCLACRKLMRELPRR